MTWTQITSERAQLIYGIPVEIANAAENTFFGVPINLPYKYDDPRPFMAFLRNRKYPHVVTLYIKTIHPESWEGDDGILINPFLDTVGGHLTLDKADLANLITIFSSYQKQLASTSGENKKVFQKIEDLYLIDYHIHPEWFPKTKQEYYVQTYDPLMDDDVNHFATIVNFSKTVGFAKIHMAIAQFPIRELQDPNFKPFDHGYSRVNLDITGIQELVMLLEKQKNYFK